MFVSTAACLSGGLFRLVLCMVSLARVLPHVPSLGARAMGTYSCALPSPCRDSCCLPATLPPPHPRVVTCQYNYIDDLYSLDPELYRNLMQLKVSAHFASLLSQPMRTKTTGVCLDLSG